MTPPIPHTTTIDELLEADEEFIEEDLGTEFLEQLLSGESTETSLVMDPTTTEDEDPSLLKIESLQRQNQLLREERSSLQQTCYDTQMQLEASQEENRILLSRLQAQQAEWQHERNQWEQGQQQQGGGIISPQPPQVSSPPSSPIRPHHNMTTLSLSPAQQEQSRELQQIKSMNRALQDGNHQLQDQVTELQRALLAAKKNGSSRGDSVDDSSSSSDNDNEDDDIVPVALQESSTAAGDEVQRLRATSTMSSATLSDVPISNQNSHGSSHNSSQNNHNNEAEEEVPSNHDPINVSELQSTIETLQHRIMVLVEEKLELQTHVDSLQYQKSHSPSTRSTEVSSSHPNPVNHLLHSGAGSWFRTSPNDPNKEDANMKKYPKAFGAQSPPKTVGPDDDNNSNNNDNKTPPVATQADMLKTAVTVAQERELLRGRWPGINLFGPNAPPPSPSDDPTTTDTNPSSGPQNSPSASKNDETTKPTISTKMFSMTLSSPFGGTTPSHETDPPPNKAGDNEEQPNKPTLAANMMFPIHLPNPFGHQTHPPTKAAAATSDGGGGSEPSKPPLATHLFPMTLPNPFGGGTSPSHDHPTSTTETSATATTPWDRLAACMYPTDNHQESPPTENDNTENKEMETNSEYPAPLTNIEPILLEDEETIDYLNTPESMIEDSDPPPAILPTTSLSSLDHSAMMRSESTLSPQKNES